ncbi:MAG: RNase adapter RapZ [Deltaproteobacteria bacterium]|nr:RNase adapter RapZ [Deltaproteobacteria bacterium]
MGSKKTIYLITGYSGAGKTNVLRYFEESGFYCVDNLPADLLPGFLELMKRNKDLSKIAVVIDARSRSLLNRIETHIQNARQTHNLKILFLEADLKSIIKRFKESRLKHPLALNGTLQEGYKLEHKLLHPLQHCADLVINSSNITVHELKALIKQHLFNKKKQEYEVHLMSFGFKNGVPAEADTMLDVRFLKNPHFHQKLKHKTGKTTEVQNFIFKDKKTHTFFKKSLSFLLYLIKQYQKEGKSYSSIAIGCTGGKHRSVAIVEKLAKELSKEKNLSIKIEHRDL